MFALYLDIQKQIDIDALDETEVKGRWKSFVSRWNRGDLAEGWYDPKTLEKSQAEAASSSSAVADRYAERRTNDEQRHHDDDEDDDEDDEEDEDGYGPTLPESAKTSQGQGRMLKGGRHGATIPSLQDLRSRDEQAREDAVAARAQQRQDLNYSRALDRKLQRDRLDEIAPRAEPGTRERQLEKKREKADSNRAFASAKGGGGDMEEVRDADMMGEEDSLAEMKRMQKENERKKNERELRKEEILRARRAEREARVAGLKEKEEKTMSMLKEIVRQRFGGSTEE
ncbi:hypothetical protein PV08_02737 [Exophiala spinifera]|uniref:Uncharacterized protein n=1 Tax=Exophiala spinifera TaxID=91928 RepID=A0A0D2C4D2_9EURO|nr:uncharacterized protein PV08_02737 [Exophiala spinifera]KIW18449.1 hypothetical protein PV08_02737 [Exophiala spinifera]